MILRNTAGIVLRDSKSKESYFFSYCRFVGNSSCNSSRGITLKKYISFLQSVRDKSNFFCLLKIKLFENLENLGRFRKFWSLKKLKYLN